MKLQMPSYTLNSCNINLAFHTLLNILQKRMDCSWSHIARYVSKPCILPLLFYWWAGLQERGERGEGFLISRRKFDARRGNFLGQDSGILHVAQHINKPCILPLFSYWWVGERGEGSWFLGEISILSQYKRQFLGSRYRVFVKLPLSW